MRHYPTVPNVFRVGSTQNLNKAKSSATAASTSTTTAATATHGPQQQQQQQRLHINNATQKQKQQQPVFIGDTTSATATATKANDTNDNKLKQQQTFRYNTSNNNKNNNNLANSNSATMLQTQSQQQQPHKITTTASIECSSFSATQAGRRERQQQQQQQQLHQSPYATLPRALPSFGAIMGTERNNHSNGNRNGSGNGNNNGNGRSNHSAHNGNGNEISEASVGVINTISGSIPATGFTTASGSGSGNGNSNGQCLRSATDLDDSDLNVNLNNSYTDLHKLNPLQRKYQQQLQQQQPREFLVSRPGGRMSVSHYQQKQQQQLMGHYNNSLERGGGFGVGSGSGSGGYLWILTPVAASISVAIVIAAIAGPQWLFTEEKLPNANYNGTANFNMLDDGAYITKYTKSSLWILCTALQGVETYNCIKIDYFPKEGYQPDPLDSTPAIPYTVTKSCPFFLASGIFLLISFIVFLIPTCSHQNNLYYFSAGIMFIVSGLLMLIGLIAYISILKAEIGSKLRSRSTLQPALFKVTYGQSFFLFVFGFIATEFVGLLNIFLYISLQEIGYYSRLPCFTISTLQEKLKEAEHPQSHTYKSYKHSAGDRKPQHSGARLTNGNNHHQVQPSLSALELELDSKKLLQQLPGFVACRKHPNAADALLNNDLDRRYFFEKTLPSKCNLHSKNFAKSLNELYTEPAPSIGPPPPPSAIKMGGTQTLPRFPPHSSQYGDVPQEFPLTRSVSTTTDIFANNTSKSGINGYPSGDNGGSSHHATPRLERKNRRNMATNTRSNDRTMTLNENERVRESERKEREQTRNRESDSLRRQQKRHQQMAAAESDELYDDDEPQRLCGLKRGIRKTKDELFHEFCKRAGMRPKPKNIYFIASEEESAAAEEVRRRRCGGSSSIGSRIGVMRGELKTSHKHLAAELADKDMNGHVADGGDDEDDDIGNNEQMTEFDDDLQMHDERGGFKQLHHDDEHIYLFQDNRQYLAHPMRNMRRSSMFVEPTHLHKLNSNLSLTAIYPPPEKLYQKSPYGLLERSDSAVDVWPPPAQQLNAAQYYGATKSVYGGSHNHLHQDYLHRGQLYQSRTLPRSFLKRTTDSQDSIGGGASLHASTNALHNTYSASQSRLTNLILQQHQQAQLQQQARYLSQSQMAGVYNSALTLHKSSDDLGATASNGDVYERMQQHQQQQQLVNPSYSTPQQQPCHQQQRISVNNAALQPTVQWPAAIPSSPSGYGAVNFHRVYPTVVSSATHITHTPHLAHALLARSSSGSAGGGVSGGSFGSGSIASAPPAMGIAAAAAAAAAGAQLPAKFQRAYAFDEQRRPSAVLSDAFDLDEIERERRRSHASLFSGISSLSGAGGGSSNDHYDLINGTAV